MDEYRFGLRTLEEIDAEQDAALPLKAPSAGHLIILGVLCLVSSFAVMVAWSLVLGFVLAIVATCVIAGAAIGGE